ncbi:MULTISPECIES: hypothetical protein [Shewanella]|uniref:hypothetical protein n=1 Tax=Shewanella TaxID=22 RepID=UPI00399A0952
MLKLLSELMGTVAELATICASHTHANGATPDQSSDFNSKASLADGQKDRLDPITK